VRVFRGVTELTLRVNGEERRAVVRPGDILLGTLRESLGLTGVKAGCENGDCGACPVLLDGRPVKSCLVLTLSAASREITTIEGLRDTPLQRAFVRENGFQCGFCTPGVLMNAHALLAANPSPPAETVRTWLESNLCRCTGYEGIERAVRRGGVSD
jgi:carbon-monoxide dehydrogenase small subunit